MIRTTKQALGLYVPRIRDEIDLKGDINRDEMLAVIAHLQGYGLEIMTRKSAARGVGNLSEQGFEGVCTRALSDKTARIMRAVNVDRLHAVARLLDYPLEHPVPQVEWDKVLLDMLDIANYMNVAAYILLRQKLDGTLPIDDD